MKALINYIIENYKVHGTVFVSKETRIHSHPGEISTVHKVSVFLSSCDVEIIEANTFFNACKLIIATLDAKGLNEGDKK
jgi:hypothetical protein